MAGLAGVNGGLRKPAWDGGLAVYAADRKKFPDFDDIRARLRFCPNDGRIWLDDQRMSLVHAKSLASLRRELIDTLGVDTARGLLTRMGYASGAQDADFARKVRSEQSLIDAFLVGPQLHMLEGAVSVEPLRVEIDVEKGHYYGEFIWSDSVELHCHLVNFGLSAQPVCWTQIGYAAGFTSVFMGRPILYRELECCGAGASRCRIVGKPIDDWHDSLEDLRYFQSEAFVNRVPRRAHAVSATFGSEPVPLSNDSTPSDGGDEMVGLSSGFNAACHNVKKVAGTQATVIFLGETGVGKELFARNLHAVSKRASGPFVAVNCAAIPETLVESELFGVEKGAYTGAFASRPGRFEWAEGGTLFLDEIGTLAMSAQGKLLRVLQSREIERVGDTRTRKVDVRVVAATNEDLKKKVQEGTFRSDLFYRLHVFPIHIPPLRERRDDLPLLMRHFLTKFSRMHERRITGFTERAIEALLDYDYPGNIRELENMIERAVILSGDDAPLDVFLLFKDSASPAPHGMNIDERGNLAASRHADRGMPELERIVDEAVDKQVPLDTVANAIMMTAVKRARGNLSAAAKMIGLTRPQLAYRLKNVPDVDTGTAEYTIKS